MDTWAALACGVSSSPFPGVIHPHLARTPTANTGNREMMLRDEVVTDNPGARSSTSPDISTRPGTPTLHPFTLVGRGLSWLSSEGAQGGGEVLG